jgi:hypothetical protein
VGNRAMLRLQPKLTVSDPADPLEREADRVADQVMRMPADAPAISTARQKIQRDCDTCPDDDERKGMDVRGPVARAAAQRFPTSESETAAALSPAASHAGRSPPDHIVARAIYAGEKTALPDQVRSYFEPRFGRDFGAVRVHMGPTASEAARSIGALAFTIGHDIVFRGDSYVPDSPSGRRLLAHELSHVAQQTWSARAPPRRSTAASAPSRHARLSSRQARHGPADRPSANLALTAAGTTGAIHRIPPPVPTPLPATQPTPGPTDFLITQVGTSTTAQIFFARGSSALRPSAVAAISALKAAAPSSVRLVGFASADEPAVTALDRAKAVKAALIAPPNPVTVGSAIGNAAATASRSDFVGVRSVEILVGAATPSTLDCARRDAAGNLVNPPKQPCSVMDPATETAFTAALAISADAMTRANTAVGGSLSATTRVLVDRFFGNHSPSTMTKLRTNIGRLQTQVGRLSTITSCGGQCDIGGCSSQGPIAYNNGFDAAATMTVCVPVFKSLHVNDAARNLIHESAHGTTPLGGTPATGTRDVAYRHERMLFHLSTADRLRNSDSYALFAMFLREAQITGTATAVPAGMSTPSTDTLTGLSGPETRAINLAIARLEKRLTWAADWSSQLYGEVVDVRSGARTWAASWADRLMTEASVRFPLTAPPAAPNLTDQTRVAGIVDRYRRMHRAVKRSLNISRMAAGVVSWPGSALIAGNTLQVGPEFFRATPQNQVSLLLESLAGATIDVEPAFVPAYVSLAKWMHDQNP